MALVKCKECGIEISDCARSCPHCGRIYAGKSKLLAILLAFFLGTFGAQYFYMGYWGSGLLCLLLSWTGIPSLIGIFSAVYYLCISDARFQQIAK